MTAEAPGPWQVMSGVWSPASKLTMAQRSVLTIILKHADFDGGNAFPSVKRIARCASCARSTAAAALNALVAGGLVSRMRTGRKCTYRVDVVRVAALADQYSIQTIPRDQSVPDSDLMRAHSGPKMVRNVPPTVPNDRTQYRGGRRTSSPAKNPAPIADVLRGVFVEGHCQECWRRSSLVLCEACQARLFGEVTHREAS